jgi:hypothetical protein
MQGDVGTAGRGGDRRETGTRTDKHGRALSAYPLDTDHGRLLGFNVFGNAAYATEERAVLATLDEAGTLRLPPRERWLSGEFPLSAVELSPADYVRYVADEAGPWRALTELAGDALRAEGADPSEFVSATPAEGDVADLVPALSSPDVDRATEAASDLRRLALDRPTDIAPHVEVLVDVVSEAGARTMRSEDGDGGENAGEDRPDFDRLAIARDVAFVLARVTRSSPEALGPHLDAVLGALGAAPDGDAGYTYVEYLLDVLDVLGRADPATFASEVRTRLDASLTTVPTLRALYRLEHRYARREHPSLEDEDLRAAIEALLGAEDTAVREAAWDVDTIHGFHR